MFFSRPSITDRHPGRHSCHYQILAAFLKERIKNICVLYLYKIIRLESILFWSSHIVLCSPFSITLNITILLKDTLRVVHLSVKSKMHIVSYLVVVTVSGIGKLQSI